MPSNGNSNEQRNVARSWDDKSATYNDMLGTKLKILLGKFRYMKMV